jgi:hypothetical protein
MQSVGGFVTPDKIAELRVKHLEILQGLISRMAGYGASFKSYCITLVTAVIGFAFTLHRPALSRSRFFRSSHLPSPTPSISESSDGSGDSSTSSVRKAGTPCRALKSICNKLRPKHI